jgi:hypothetical protein
MPRRLAPYVESREERSEIRKRVVRSHTPISIAPFREEGARTRTARIDLKVNFAKIVLSDLAATSDRARLLRTAIVRRDETLLDELLGIGSPPDLEA